MYLNTKVNDYYYYYRSFFLAQGAVQTNQQLMTNKLEFFLLVYNVSLIIKRLVNCLIFQPNEKKLFMSIK